MGITKSEDVERIGCSECGEDVVTNNKGRISCDPGNPGSFQDINKKVKELYPVNFEGVRLTGTKMLSNHFRVGHTITLSSVTPSGYKFGALYQGSTMVGNEERYPCLECTITPNGKQSIEFAHTLGSRCRIKMSAQIADNKYEAFSSMLEYRSDNCTASVALKNPHLREANGTLVLHYLQAVSSRLALGAELACFRDYNKKLSPASKRTLISGAVRYSTGPFTISTTFSEAGLDVCCHKRASEQLQLGAEIHINSNTHESLGSIIYQLNVPKARFIFKGMLDSGYTVSGLFEKQLSFSTPNPSSPSSLLNFNSSLLLSAALNHKKGLFRVGIGLNVG